MSGLKFTLCDLTSVLPDNLSGLNKNYIEACTEINTLFNSPKELFCKLLFVQLGKAATEGGL